MNDAEQTKPRITWHQVVADLRRDITDGTLKPRDQAPSLAELAARYAVSTRTVRRVYDTLEADGLIKRRHSGHVVAGEATQPRVIPNFHKVLADFRYDIANGLLLPGQQLLPLNQLSVIYNVDQDLIRRVYDQLEHNGLIERRRGFGVFIAGAPIWGEAVHYAVAHLRMQIDRGVYRPGQQLPTHPVMARLIGVGHHTVTKAYAQLASEGVLESRQGIGAFVCDGSRRMSKIERVQASIREKIGDGRLPPQAHIDVNATAAELGVSRRTVSSACAELAKQRLVAVGSSRGPIVLGSLATTYRDIVNAVQRDIDEGRLKPGDTLADEAAMIAAHGTSNLAVQNARAELHALGLVELLPDGTLVVTSR